VAKKTWKLTSEYISAFNNSTTDVIQEWNLTVQDIAITTLDGEIPNVSNIDFTETYVRFTNNTTLMFNSFSQTDTDTNLVITNHVFGNTPGFLKIPIGTEFNGPDGYLKFGFSGSGLATLPKLEIVVNASGYRLAAIPYIEPSQIDPGEPQANWTLDLVTRPNFQQVYRPFVYSMQFTEPSNSPGSGSNSAMYNGRYIMTATADPTQTPLLVNGQPLPVGSVVKVGSQKYFKTEVNGVNEPLAFMVIVQTPPEEWGWNATGVEGWEDLQGY
jgi:hypothetical protein